MQVVCGPSCAYKLAQKKRGQATAKAEKANRAQLRARKRALMSISDHHKKASASFNAYIRERDRLLPCISCNRHHQGQWHAGHFRASTQPPRYNVFNVNGQCQPCNVSLSGNLLRYREGLIKKYGLVKVEEIECDNRVRNYSAEYLERLTRVFRRRARHLHALRERLGVYE